MMSEMLQCIECGEFEHDDDFDDENEMCRECAAEAFDRHDGFYGFCHSCGDARPDPEVVEETGDQICRDCFEALKDESGVCQVCGTEAEFYFLDTGEAFCADHAEGHL